MLWVLEVGNSSYTFIALRTKLKLIQLFLLIRFTSIMHCINIFKILFFFFFVISARNKRKMSKVGKEEPNEGGKRRMNY